LRRRPCLCRRCVVFGIGPIARKEKGDGMRMTAARACRCMNWLMLFGCCFCGPLESGVTSTNPHACAALFALSLIGLSFANCPPLRSLVRRHLQQLPRSNPLTSNNSFGPSCYCYTIKIHGLWSGLRLHFSVFSRRCEPPSLDVSSWLNSTLRTVCCSPSLIHGAYTFFEAQSLDSFSEWLSGCLMESPVDLLLC